ncbi:hypothetical protein [Nitrososphaera sp.]|uniref:hypothetical protein n=1 Tax=Nitrososphaera sp. TaxID=1971748 RepID=UPI002EDA09CB
MDSRAAHTAEHAFIGALQNVLGQTLRVRKVEHKKDDNTAFVVIPQLDVDAVVKAEIMVNALIAEGRSVTTRTYPSLEGARKHNPSLRANEERISGEVRVVEIEDHDVAACAMDHMLPTCASVNSSLPRGSQRAGASTRSTLWWDGMPRTRRLRCLQK